MQQGQIGILEDSRRHSPGRLTSRLELQRANALQMLALITIFVAVFVRTHSTSAQTPIPCGYEVAHVIQGPLLPGFGYPVTFGTGICRSGRYVSGYYTYINSRRAFVYDVQRQQLVTLPVEISSVTSANDVTDDGVVVGRAGDSGFIYTLATGQTVLLPPAVSSGGMCTVNGINPSHVVCGTRTVQVSPLRTTAFIWDSFRGFTDVGMMNGESTLGWGIADDGMIVGHFPSNTLSESSRAFTYQQGQMNVIGPIPGGFNSRTRGTAPDGHVVIMGLVAPAPAALQETFIFSGNTFVRLNMPADCIRTYSDSMNSHGVAGGGCNDLEGTWRGVVWFGRSARIINDMILNTADFYIEGITGVSEDGAMLANGSNGAGHLVALLLRPHVRIVGDSNCDNMVNVNDLLSVINAWGACTDCEMDFDLNGTVNVNDLLIVISNWSF